ncbi:hypothetical protein C2G38_2157142 [Gigaspora rosea]|uniref:Uncharacterized protein n=1 Tax=Gigaspora rosea TaxID=44941 RepID=A0A397W3H6_9GLOM|nr:hypothetical protein C2G38_2157142 [Gigaspora rosea]
MKTIVEKVKRGHPPKFSKLQEIIAKSSSKIQAKVSKSSSKTKPILKVSKSLQKNASKSSQNKSFRKSLYYYEDEGNIQNDDNDDNNNTSPLSKSSRSQNQKNITFEDNMDNSSTSHTAANILKMISEDNNEDNDNNDDRQHNDIYTLDDDTYSISGNDNEEFQLGICLLSLDLSLNLILKLFENANSSTAILSNEYNREVQSEKSKGKPREHEASQILAEFDGMNNILEICNWLVKHPSILQLANQIYTAFSSLIENIRTFNESSMPSSAISSKINNNRVRFMDGARIWNEEIKCLFLRARFPLATCIDEFVKKIFGLNQSVLGHVKNYKAIKKGIDILDIYIYIIIDIMFIGGTNQRELQKCGAVKKLVQLIREMFKIHWQGKNIDQVKNLDNLTKNMHVPSRSGLDIASQLNFN